MEEIQTAVFIEMTDLSCIRPARTTFKKAQHLRKSRHFAEAQQKGFRTLNPAFIFYYLPQDNTPIGARIGVVASRKVGPAVKRNLGKRWARQCFRLHPEVSSLSGDIVLILRHSFNQYTYKEFEGFYHQACSKALRYYSKSL